MGGGEGASAGMRPAVRRVLGIDPGITCTGYGVVDYDGRGGRWVAAGGIRPSARLDFFGKIKCIRDGVVRVIDEYAPAEMAVEQIFVHRNPGAALILGHARGAAIVAGLERGLALHEYTALQVKKAVSGYGRADKVQVQKMIRMLLSLPAVPEPADAADALAVALTHCFWTRR
jgi:crossover junction endodeoxyribonuclease RuvC